MRWFRLFLIALAMSGALRAQAPDGVRTRLVSTPLLRGEFEQVKTLQGFRNPLRSRGSFVLARRRGVIWTTREPFPSAVVATRDRVYSEEADGRREMLVDGSSAPDASAINTLLLAMIGGDVDALATRFVLRETLLADGAWELELLPRSDDLKRALKRIELAGDRYVRRASIEEAGGDKSEIRFEPSESAPAELSTAESARLD